MPQRTLHLVRTAAMFVTISLLMPVHLFGQGGGLSPKDEAELKAVTLTMGSVEKLVKTMEAYVNLLKTDEEFLEFIREAGAEEEGEDGFSIDGLATEMGRLPAKGQAALTSQGLTIRHYVVLTVTSVMNGMGDAGSSGGRTDGPLAPGATRANIDFIRANADNPLFAKYRALLEEMEELEDGGGATAPDGCDGER